MVKYNLLCLLLMLSACRTFREQGKSESSRIIDQKSLKHISDSSFWNSQYKISEYWRIRSDSLLEYDLNKGYIFGKGAQIEKWQSIANKQYRAYYSDTVEMKNTKENLSQMNKHKHTKKQWDTWLWVVGGLGCVILLSPVLGKAIKRK